jgi:hypothetical protein
MSNFIPEPSTPVTRAKERIEVHALATCVPSPPGRE